MLVRGGCWWGGGGGGGVLRLFGFGGRVVGL